MTSQEKKTLGKIGEAYAAQYLIKKKNYKLLQTNWRFGKGEIDIIARQNDILVFVEVKTRQQLEFFGEEIWISKGQETSLINTAEHYIDQIKWEGEVRLDLILVDADPKRKLSAEHFEDIR